jgi:hypothetical protein
MIGILAVLTIGVIVSSDRLVGLVARMYGYNVYNGRVV